MGMGYSGESEMRKLTEATGGRVINVGNKFDKLKEAFDQISAELRSQYNIGYTSTNTKFDGGYRKLEIKSKRITKSNPALATMPRRGSRCRSRAAVWSRAGAATESEAAGKFPTGSLGRSPLHTRRFYAGYSRERKTFSLYYAG